MTFDESIGLIITGVVLGTWAIVLWMGGKK